MSAIPKTISERPPATRLKEPLVLGFAQALLREQNVPCLAAKAASRALALLLQRSEERPGEPVVISALEGSLLCGFEPRTWWLVKRRLLSLGHLLASAGGGPPSGRPGGRGHKAAYFVAPQTLARFTQFLALQTLNGREETLKALPQTLNASGEERKLSHHRLLRLLDKKETSDVPSLEGDAEKPTPEKIWAWIRQERSERVKLRLLRLLETLLLAETLEKAMARRETLKAPPETLKDLPKTPPLETPPKRRPRSPSPLWSEKAGEEQAVLTHVREILAWANRDFGATFDRERSSQDTLRYPFEHVRSAVSNVLLKKARGYRFTNPGAVLWDAITLEGYKLEEFSVGPFEEVLDRIGKSSGSAPCPKRPSRAPDLPRFEPERKRRQLLQTLYEQLPGDVREDLDRRAESLAREELGASGSTLGLGLVRVEKRNQLLVREHASRNELTPEESQISVFGSDRNEPEPHGLVDAKT